MIKEWRPDDWVNPWVVDPDAFEAGASAMLSAVLKWLDEPCDRHPLDPSRYNYWMEEHRKDCPQCMAELRGEK